jgi:hypothetical protein
MYWKSYLYAVLFYIEFLSEVFQQICYSFLLFRDICVRAKRSPRHQMLIQLESGENIFIPVSHSGENKNKEK